ncbi:MAG: L-threonylcarbamoyladenylate synthase, partial [Alphaproteobacteria bacterium]
PSANVSGAISPTTARHVEAGLAGRVDMILDGGPCRVGVESTVLDLSEPAAVLLRPGGVTAEELARVLGPIASPNLDLQARPRSPGLMLRHYAPSIPVRLDVDDIRPGEALLAFGPAAPQGAVETLNLSASADLTEAAANLFRFLHALDRPGIGGIAVVPIPETGLGRAINDRLRRAAAG